MPESTNFPAPSGSIHLQYFGRCHAVKVGALVPGCVLVWNTGATSEVIAIRQASKCFAVVTTRTDDGSTYERRMKLSRLVGYSPRLTAKRAAVAGG